MSLESLLDEINASRAREAAAEAKVDAERAWVEREVRRRSPSSTPASPTRSPARTTALGKPWRQFETALDDRTKQAAIAT